MSGRDHSDDSSGNLAAGEPTVPDFTVDNSQLKTPDPNDTQQDAQVTRRSKQDQNVTNDPTAASRRNDISHGAADGDTMDDPLADRNMERSDAFTLDITKEDPRVADKKGRANPYALDDTLLESPVQGRGIDSDPLAVATPDTTADLLHELFQSAIMTNAGIAADGINMGANPAAKAVNRSQNEKLFDGRFEILTELGSGGMGAVFKAHDRELDRIIAIKVLNFVGRDSDARNQRFLQEARAAAKLSHPNIIQIHDLHTADNGERYIQFEYVEGCSLSNLLAGFKKKRVLMPLKTVLDCAIQSLAALDCMHENNIVHRDVKPANIMLEKKTNARDLTKFPHDPLQDGARTASLQEYPDVEYRVKLVDFGLAKIRDEDDNTMMSITRKGQAVGTAAYMSPEQCSGERVDGCSDIYSLGCILFEMLTGHVPFRGADSAETMRLHLNSAIPLLSMERPNLPAIDEFERIVNKMLAKERIDRYQKAEHAKNDLKELHIGIKSGAIMEALQLEKEINVTNTQNFPSELHNGIPKIDKPDGVLDHRQSVPGALESTVPELHDQHAHKQQNEASSRADSQAHPQKAERKIYADPLALDETAQEGHGQGRKVYPDPLAMDATQPSVSAPAGGAPAGRVNTNWDPVGGGTPPVSQNSKQSTPAKKRTGQGFSEGDLFARKYEIKGHIGQGGMGIVYKALDLVLGRTVAIKFLKGKSGISQMEMSRFQQEAKAIASLNHTNIIRVYDMSVTDDGDPFFVLEYLDGHALSSEIKGKKQLPLERALSIVSQVCDALQHAHDHGVIHRDIKPSNLMIVPEKDGTESVKLLDFGIAKLNAIDEETLLKLTKTGELFGSPHYMSPEQCTGNEIAEQSDIYSLGCVLYELICGSPPFSGQSALDTLDKHKNASLPSVASSRKDFPESKMIDALLDKMMAKEPVDRYQTPGEVKVAIQEIERKLKGTPLQQFKKHAFPNGLSDPRGKKNAALLVAGLAAASCLAVAPMWFIYNRPAPNTAPLRTDLKPWKTYDLNGQLLFNKGAYQAAEKQFLIAVEKAKTEIKDKRTLHLFTSLKELRILYTVQGNQNASDEIQGELIDCEKPEESKLSWDELSTMTSKLSSNSDLNTIVNYALSLILQADDASPTPEESRKRLALQVERVKLLANSEGAVNQLLVLDAYLCKRGGIQLAPESTETLNKLLDRSPDLLLPAIARLLVSECLEQPNAKLRTLEKFADYARQQASSPMERFKAEIDLCEVYRRTDRKAAAIQTIESCLLELEQLLPRRYWLLTCALSARAHLYIQDHKFSAAIPLLLRAMSICECETQEKRNSRNYSDDLKSLLAYAYAGSGDTGKAEKILLTLLKNSNAKSSRRADWLAQLGSLYEQIGQIEKGKKALEESVALYHVSNKSNRSARYSSAIENLNRLQNMSAPGPEGESNPRTDQSLTPN